MGQYWGRNSESKFLIGLDLEKVFFAPGPKSFCDTFTEQANIYGRRKSGFGPNSAHDAVKSRCLPGNNASVLGGHCGGTPNGKVHLMVARRTIVDADMRVAFSRE